MTMPAGATPKIIRRVNRELGKFIECVRHLATQQANSDLRKEANRLYRDIHFSCIQHDVQAQDLSIVGLADEHQQAARDILNFGRNNFDAFNAHATSYLCRPVVEPGQKRDPQAVAEAFAQFIKSSQAHDLVSNGGRNNPDEVDEAIIDLFNGLFGIEITRNLAKSIRVEQLGRILAYALSSQCATDIEELESDPINLDPERRNSWIMNRINCSNRTFIYRVETDEQGKQKTAAAISDQPFDGSSVRGAWIADACVVDEGRKTLILGGATSGQASDNQQAGQAVDKRLATEQMVAQEFVGNPPQPNPYYKWGIETFQINLGLAAADRMAETGKGVGRQMFSHLFQGRAPAREDILALSQLGHLSMFAEGEAYGQVGRVLGLTNIHTIGCDTEAYHKQRVSAVGAGGRNMAGVVAQTLEQAAAVLARPDTALPLGMHGTGSIKPLLETLVRATGNHFMNFPAKGRADVSENEIQALGNLRRHFAAIGNKLAQSQDPGNNNYRRELRSLCILLEDSDDLAEAIRNDGKLPDKSMRWDNDIYQRLVDRDPGRNKPTGKSKGPG